jgi:hypothetical protein
MGELEGVKRGEELKGELIDCSSSASVSTST